MKGYVSLVLLLSFASCAKSESSTTQTPITAAESSTTQGPTATQASITTTGKVFPGLLTLKTPYTDSMAKENSPEYQQLYKNVTDFFNTTFKNETDYGETIIVNIKQSSAKSKIQIKAETSGTSVTISNMFEVTTKLNADAVANLTEEALKGHSYFNNDSYQKLSQCDIYGCDEATTDCVETDGLKCTCKSGYSKKDKEEKTCSDSLLILIIVAVLCGALILGLAAGLIFTSIRANKRQKNPEKRHLLREDYSDNREIPGLVSAINPAANEKIFPTIQTSNGSQVNQGSEISNPYEMGPRTRRLPERDYDDDERKRAVTLNYKSGFLFGQFTGLIQQGLNICTSGSATSCEECLLIHPKCAWCSKEEFGSTKFITSRCDFVENLITNGCAGELETPKSSINIVENLPLSSKGSSLTLSDVTQIMPQKISLNLRPGDKTSFRVQVRQVEDYPVDLYYLMDLSLSMKDDLDNIRNLGTKLAEEMRKLTSNFRLGFGSFVDKNISPFSYTAPRYQNNPCIGYKLFPHCVPSFGFRHLLSLTDKVDSFNEEVRKQKVSRNRDAPEGGFDAILQAAVCKEKIGWRKEASHLLVFTTDDVPHIALDGKLGGLVQPHDGQCHLNEANEYSASNQLDYPSLALLGEKLDENNIHLIFAVTKAHYILYKSIRSKVELTVWDSPEDVSLTFTATCQDGFLYPGLRKCADLQIGDTVSFEVSVEARSCPAENTSHTFTIKPAGFRDTLEVEVAYNCTCGCTKRMERNSSKCSGNGTYTCGLCECNSGYLGSKCECEEGENGNMYQNMCREAEGKPVCSGRGECSCNQCVCYKSEFGRIYGLFCECNDFSCARYKGVLCSGIATYYTGSQHHSGLAQLPLSDDEGVAGPNLRKAAMCQVATPLIHIWPNRSSVMMEGQLGPYPFLQVALNGTENYPFPCTLKLTRLTASLMALHCCISAVPAFRGCAMMFHCQSSQTLAFPSTRHGMISGNERVKTL
ncbi:Integrin beta-5 [Chelonia mydas]|uniref:Integrin beta n=1 Tax=Chelonia mydas TaxID=8469 RepID=M7C1U8_CHEMY|nr:Integrin beta-5 [Chelonia mydas]